MSEWMSEREREREERVGGEGRVKEGGEESSSYMKVRISTYYLFGRGLAKV